MLNLPIFRSANRKRRSESGRPAVATSNTDVTASSARLNLKRSAPENRSAIASGHLAIMNGTRINSTTGPIRRRSGRIVALFAVLALFAGFAAPTLTPARAAEGSVEAIFGTVLEVLPPNELAVATDAGVVRLVLPDSNVLAGNDVSSLLRLYYSSIAAITYVLRAGALRGSITVMAV